MNVLVCQSCKANYSEGDSVVLSAECKPSCPECYKESDFYVILKESK